MSFTQATPMRPVPGAFLNTPAVRKRVFDEDGQPFRPRRLFQSPGGDIEIGYDAPTEPDQALPLQPVADPTQVAPPQPPLTKAARYINDSLQSDEAYPDLSTYCKTFSSEYEVPPFESALSPFQKTHMYEIPQSVFEQYNRAEVSTSMGLFAELNHAWVSIDNCLYLWDYTHPNPELIGFEDSQQSITSVELVAPKPEVFVKEINYMLVVATTSQMFLLGVAAQPTPSGAKTVNLYQTNVTLGLRGTEAHAIAGSSNGRIFFAGQSDGDIYEFWYQQEEGWFSSKTQKINHTSTGYNSLMPKAPFIWGAKEDQRIVQIVVDDSRNLVYSLSNNSTIRTYHMEDPRKLTKVIEMTKIDCLRDITHRLNGTSKLLTERMEIVSICPITATEDARVHLMAVTSTGCRLFMSAASASSYMITTSPSQAPGSMALHSIKFPPSSGSERRRRAQDPYGRVIDQFDSESRSLLRTRKGVRFAPGYFLAFVDREDGEVSDTLFMSTPDTGRIKNASLSHNQLESLRLYEQANWVPIGSRAEDIGLVAKPFAGRQNPKGFGNELAAQFDDPASEFAILTNTGIHVFRRRRLVDIFAAAIRTSAGEEGLKSDFNKFNSFCGRVETVTAALAVACGQANDQRLGMGRGAIDQATEDRARQVFVNHGGNPMLPEQDGQMPSIDMVKPSSRHSALALYVSRLIRTLWRSPVISIGVDGAGALAITSRVPLTKLASVQESLERVRSFLEANKSFIQGLSGPADLQRAGNKQEELALQGEHQAMHALQVLMGSITEGISFVTMLFDERVVEIYTRLDDNSRQQLQELTYERLFSQSSGKDLAKLLVKAIVNRNIESGSNVETVADALRRRCGSFCSPDDVVIFKAQEQLKRASELGINPSTSRTLLHESLKLFSRVAGSLTHANLESAIEQYIGLKYYAGAISLCLVVAREKDRGNTAMSWENDGKPPGDSRALVYEERKRCYDLIHRVLQHLDAAVAKEPEMVDGKRTLIATKRDEAYDVVNESSDEFFHFDLYEWYVQQGLTDRLLSIESPHVVTFLQRLAAASDVSHADLLCRYYTMRNRFFEAAQVQHTLAQASNVQLSIKQRLLLLSKAKTNVNINTPGVGRQELQMLNHEVTELLEVAHIQDDLLDRLRADGRIPDERKEDIETALDGPILGLTELFNSYADAALYHDLCLMIYSAADFRNATTIATTWSNLIQQVYDDVANEWDHFNNAGHGRNQLGLVTPPQPYEKLITVVQSIRHRTGDDMFIFPVPTLLPDICRFSVENTQDGRIGADPNWPVILFLQLNFSYDLVTRVLEQMFESQDVPFRGQVRARVVEWIVYVAKAWVKELSRGGRAEGLERWVGELLAECEAFIKTVRGANEGGMDLAELAREVRDTKQKVEAAVGGFAGGRSSFGASLGFL